MPHPTSRTCRCFPALLGGLLACEPSDQASEIALLSELGAPADECALPCVVLSGPAGRRAALSSGEVVIAQASIGDDGLVELCPPPASLEPGELITVAVDGEVVASASADIRPFGYALGRERAWGAVDAIASAEAWALEEAPVFSSAPGSWYAEGITSPHLSADGQTLYFSGKASGSGPYRLGAVALDGLAAAGEAALLIEPPAGRWDAAGQVSPTLVEVGDERWLYYHGLGEAAEVPVLGRAVSVGGGPWLAPGAPSYGDPADNKISHPAALVDPDSGVIELWHPRHEGGVTLSLSADGEAFTPSCRELPMRGKSPEVTWDGERYRMTWATVSGDDDIIRWAESRDGIRWLERQEPILRGADAPWTRDGLSNAQPVELDGAPALLLVGVRDGEHSLGLAWPEGSR